MHETVGIRRASEADIPAIQRVARATWAFTYTGILPLEVQENAISAWYSGPALARQIAATNGLFLVAEADDACLAFAQFVRRPGDSAELARIYVLPMHHGRTIGTQLLEEGLVWLRRAGISRLTVEVEEENPIGRRFYERKGFVEVGRSTQHVFDHDLSSISYERAVVNPLLDRT